MSQVYAQQAQTQAASLEAACATESVHPDSQNTDSDSSDGKSREAYLQQGLEKPSSKVGLKHRVKCVNENGEEKEEEEEEEDLSDEEAGSGDLPCKFEYFLQFFCNFLKFFIFLKFII